MGQVLKERGPMFRKPRRPRLRPGQPRNTPNPPRHSAARPQQTGQIRQIQSLGARPATGHPVITAFGLGLGKRILQDVRGSTQLKANRASYLMWCSNVCVNAATDVSANCPDRTMTLVTTGRSDL